jgi:plasmid stabilization system protein ParE
MRIELSEEAIEDLAEILEYVGKDNPRAGVRLVNGSRKPVAGWGKCGAQEQPAMT